MEAAFKVSSGEISRLELDELNARFENEHPAKLLEWSLRTFGAKIALCTAFGPEAMVLLHILSELRPKVRVFTLDTGRLPAETHAIMQKIQDLYGFEIDVYTPDPDDVRELVKTHGINLFYRSVELRELCCHVRKVRPLQRALKGLSAWITGLRRVETSTRQDIRRIEIDTLHNNIVKLNPLAQWSERQVWDYIRIHSLPYNELHDRGYRSIGCAPCTRATNPGEDLRAGRWWWENDEKKECGLHAPSSSGLANTAFFDGKAE